MSLFKNMVQFFEKTPEVGHTKADSYGARNSLPEQENPDKAVERRYFEWATGRMREAIRRIYADLFDRTGIADISRQFRFMLATQTMLFVLSEGLLLVKLNSKLKDSIERILSSKLNTEVKINVQYGTSEAQRPEVSNKQKPATSSSGQGQSSNRKKTAIEFYFMVVDRVGKNHHFAIMIYVYRNGQFEKIYNENQISPNQQDERLRNRIVNNIVRWYEALRQSQHN